MFSALQRAGGGPAPGVEFMDMPAQPVDRRRTLGDKDITAIGE